MERYLTCEASKKSSLSSVVRVVRLNTASCTASPFLRTGSLLGTTGTVASTGEASVLSGTSGR